MFHIRSSDGVKLAVYEWNRGQKETVFLIHGWPLTHEIYEYQINLLIQKGYHVVAMDLRGFGNSDAPAIGYSYDRMAMDIYQVARTLSLQRFTLVGFSMGGAIVLRYMRLFRGYNVKKLILLAAAAPCWTQRSDFPYGLPVNEVNDLIHLARTDRPQLACQFSHEQLFACPQTESIKNWFEQIALHASGIATIQAAISLRDEDGRSDLPCVHVPTVIIHGAKDVVVSNELAKIQHEGIRGSELITLDHSGHGIMYDELEKFNQTFLKAMNR